MTTLFWIILFALAGAVLSVLVAASFLLIPNAVRGRLLPHLISFAVGSLLGAALLGLLPHALATVQPSAFHKIFFVVLLGLLGFFLLEKLVLWRHCHHDHCEAHGLESSQNSQVNNANLAAGTLVIIGDAFHNFIDGILIAAAFLTDFHLGVVTAIAIAAHEVPQEVGDFIVLLHSGFKRSKALIYNMLASLATLVGALLGYYSFSDMEQLLPYLLAIAASSFIYISVADLIPDLHKRVEFKHTVQQISLIGTGVLFIYITHSTMHP
jgi:zinc and cadmium transporter